MSNQGGLGIGSSVYCELGVVYLVSLVVGPPLGVESVECYMAVYSFLPFKRGHFTLDFLLFVSSWFSLPLGQE